MIFLRKIFPFLRVPVWRNFPVNALILEIHVNTRSCDVVQLRVAEWDLSETPFYTSSINNVFYTVYSDIRYLSVPLTKHFDTPTQLNKIIRNQFFSSEYFFIFLRSFPRSVDLILNGEISFALFTRNSQSKKSVVSFLSERDEDTRPPY